MPCGICNHHIDSAVRPIRDHNQIAIKNSRWCRDVMDPENVLNLMAHFFHQISENRF
ncbi:Uncharacterised protein [Vibrio cholerae]|nr:Uncharacterised protein [Vibrio cholerae]